MKLITLNTWAGRIKEPFEAFLKEHSSETDIFCFQEIFNNYDGATGEYIKEDGGNGNILQEISEILFDFDRYFCPIAEEVFGIAIFLKKGIELVASGEVTLYQNPDYDPSDHNSDHDRKMQWVHIKHGRKDVIVMNTHGHWDAQGKDDTPHRLAQSQIINEFMEQSGMTPKILVGDFNLNPGTQSIELLKKYLSSAVMRHDDYIFVSPEILVEQCEVMPDTVSDHAPLFLQFDVF